MARTSQRMILLFRWCSWTQRHIGTQHENCRIEAGRNKDNSDWVYHSKYIHNIVLSEQLVHWKTPQSSRTLFVPTVRKSWCHDCPLLSQRLTNNRSLIEINSALWCMWGGICVRVSFNRFLEIIILSLVAGKGLLIEWKSSTLLRSQFGWTLQMHALMSVKGHALHCAWS